MRLRGSLCALATPLDRHGELDRRGFRALLARQLAAGTDGLVVGGSTGQGALLSDAESAALIEEVLALPGPRPLLVAGTGAAATAQAIARTRRAAALGAEAALVVAPYYVRPNQEGLYRHFMAVADQGGLPIVLYNVPSRTACDLLPETVARLARHPLVVGIKESRPERERLEALLALRGPDFAVLSGDDPTMAEALLAGADGVVSVAANVAPASVRRLCEDARRGDAAAVRARDGAMRDLYRFLAVEPNPIPVQWLLARQLGWESAAPRLPLVELAPAWREQGESLLAGLAGLEARALASPVSPT
ncbi:MAG: 4-hydroxy-tetrahydrodipicolinate synthase [Xanthomonadales bacterium]|nr:4-hydroxy-tetrahydrodipicolinate synthase [Xanthomonadales bacterium]